MSSLIEQAAQRLEQLRQAGVVVSQDEPIRRSPAAEAVPEAVPAPVVEAPSVHSKSVELDLQALAVQGFLTPNAPRTPIADQYRVIKRPLIKNAMGRGASTLGLKVEP